MSRMHTTSGDLGCGWFEWVCAAQRALGNEKSSYTYVLSRIIKWTATVCSFRKPASDRPGPWRDGGHCRWTSSLHNLRSHRLRAVVRFSVSLQPKPASSLQVV